MTVPRQAYSDGTIAKGRRQRNFTYAPTGDKKIDDVITSLSTRLARIESMVRDGVTAVEMTIDVSSGTTYTLTHNLGSAVRWYVVDWVGSSTSAGFDRSSTSDGNKLVLRANTTGRATVRIECSYGDMR